MSPILLHDIPNPVAQLSASIQRAVKFVNALPAK
jgi:hypothetical protein